ncbi:hypothetical protein [Yinghuangia seranimata]|uniref:hypothetical protein n=1 Tax=Yinghuangia seranimata TaxID=408067 RepID=UPI00248AB04A|nr:hypothetical protein [Yinghuangia seranimata]MDI2126721.1 hypothetical protein [Yinghuangia seranimata]
MIDACEPLAPEVAERLLDLATAHPAATTRADLLAVLVCVEVPEQLRPRLSVTLVDALSVADPGLFPDLVRTAAGSAAPAVVMWVRAFAATPGPRRRAAVEALVDVGDPDVEIELHQLLRSPDPGERAAATRLRARWVRRTAVRAANGGSPAEERLPGLLNGHGLGHANGHEHGAGEITAAVVVPDDAAPPTPEADPPAVPPPLGPPDDPWRPTYHGILRVVGTRWFELMQRHPPIHATSLPPERLGPLLVDRLLDSAVAQQADAAPEPAPRAGLTGRRVELRDWPGEMPSETAVRLARELNGAYLPDRAGLFRRYRLARRGEGPDLAVSAQSLAELAGVGPPAAAVNELLGPLLSNDPSESADAAAFLRTALEQAAAAKAHNAYPGH